MAVTIGGTPSVGAGNPPAAISHTTPAGTTLLVAQVGTWVGPDAEPFAGMTWNGVALTLHATYAFGAGPGRASLWYLLNPAIGTFSLTITAGASPGAVVVTSWVGTDLSTPLGAPAVTTGALGANPTSNALTGAATSILLAHIANLTDTLGDAGGQTFLGAPSSGGFHTNAAYKAGSGSSTTFGWTGYTSDPAVARSSILAVELKAPGVAPVPRRLALTGVGR